MTERNLRFILGGQTYLNNSIVAINNIGEGDNALLCVTDNPDCCNYRDGKFYYPNNNSAVGYSWRARSLYIDFGLQVIRLNRRNDVLSTSSSGPGTYRCEILDFTGRMQSIYITLRGMYEYLFS